MKTDVNQGDTDGERLQRISERFDAVLERMSGGRSFAKASMLAQALDVAWRLLRTPGGMDAVYARVARIEAAGLFSGSDWEHPEVLQPGITVETLRTSARESVLMECLSEIRLLAVTRGDYFHSGISAEQAHNFLNQVLALNLDLLFDQAGEAERGRDSGLRTLITELFQYLLEHIGYDNILESLIEEVWRILAQRPIRVDTVKAMISRIAACTLDPDLRVNGLRGADRLISAAFGPTNGCLDDPGLAVYQDRLQGLDAAGLQQEASGFARAMHDTGLVSPYHAHFIREVNHRQDDLLAVALGLSTTGRDAMACYQDLVSRLIEDAVFPETCQAVYGLALMLERAILYVPPVAPALWRQIKLLPCPPAVAAIERACGTMQPARTYLLAGVLNVLGQPFGIGQGNNPTCQSARALSMWAYNDPDYLLQMVAWAARDDEVAMAFEGRRLSSRELQAGLAVFPPADVDAVSAVLVPHLDRLYMEMGRLCQGRDDDPHRWINPEFHGWWVGHGQRLAVDIHSGLLSNFEGFVRHFYASYHPYYNGSQPLIHPQPAGLAITDSAARFVGWHAITILRVALDQEERMRVYFFNPNNDSGQDFGEDVVVSTHGCGELPGESSLPVEQFTSRLYLFHYDPLEHGSPEAVPAAEVSAVEAMARASWAKKR